MSFVKSTIPFKSTHAFSDLFNSYISQPESLRKYYNHPPTIEAYADAISELKLQEIDRQSLVQSIHNQYLVAGINDANLPINQLLDVNAFTVCTGHQLCLFTGPLYFIYKIMTTINLAEELHKKYPAYKFVPVYWMASEDHDFDEINHINLFDKRISFNSSQVNSPNQIPVGKLSTAGIEVILNQLREVLSKNDEVENMLQLFSTAYLTTQTLSQAMRLLVHSLFGQYGLIVIDADEVQLKNQFKQQIKDELVNASGEKHTSGTINDFANESIEVQVKPRRCNLFYFKNGLRKRIIAADELKDATADDVVLLNEALIEEADVHPERFSPNVIMRPLYQQKILPNLAYIGGPGELAYWLELKQLFSYHKLFYPILVPRNSVMVVDRKTHDQWTKFQFDTSDYFDETEDLVKNYVRTIAPNNLSFDDKLDAFAKIFNDISTQVTLVDATLKAAVSAEFSRLEAAIKVLESKLLKAEKRNHDTAISQIRKTKEKLFPASALQERHDNVLSMVYKYGASFIDDVKVQLDPFVHEFIVLISQ